MRNINLFVSTMLLALLLLGCVSVSAADWKPITPEERALKDPKVEKDADAEILFWEVKIDDSENEELVFSNYIRVKVFNERGRDSQSKVDIRYRDNSSVKDVEARVIKPDGTIFEIKKGDVFERVVAKVGKRKLKAKSFALSGVEPGAIIEYRWREVYRSSSLSTLRLDFQRDLPIHEVAYYIKPYRASIPLIVRYDRFPAVGNNATFVEDKKGFYRASMTNVPAFREEPMMPPEDEMRLWMLVFYSAETKIEVKKYWQDFNKRMWDNFVKDRMKVNDDVKKTAAEIIAGAATDEEKLVRIFDYCRTKIKNLSDDASGLTSDQLEKMKDNKSPADTIKRGYGYGGDIDYLFGALAKASGFETYYSMSGNREEVFFDPGMANAYYINSTNIAIRAGDKWRFFSPASTYVPFGMMSWREELQPALLITDKEPIWTSIPQSGPEKSLEKRTGRFRLLEDGTLEGEVVMEFTGHIGAAHKEYNDEDSQQQREETLRDNIKSRISMAEISDIRIENVQDSVKPFIYRFKVRVPGYAERTGKRLFLNPNFFEYGRKPIFTNSNRRYDIYFNYPWSEEDDITIDWPEGYEFDNADSPASLRQQGMFGDEISIGFVKDSKKIIYKRRFFFGNKETTAFAPEQYPAIKSIFEAFNKAETHTITLRQK